MQLQQVLRFKDPNGVNFVCPKIFSSERSGTYTKSQQTSYTTGTSTINVNSTVTAYSYEMTTSQMSAIYVELFARQAGTSTNLSNAYWLASRGRGATEGLMGLTLNKIDFGLYRIENGEIANQNLYSYKIGITQGTATDTSVNNAIRPVVEIDLSKVRVGRTGSGTSDNLYSLEVR